MGYFRGQASRQETEHHDTAAKSLLESLWGENNKALQEKDMGGPPLSLKLAMQKLNMETS